MGIGECIADGARGGATARSYRLVIVHGNGPSSLALPVEPALSLSLYPLDVLVAEESGMPAIRGAAFGAFEPDTLVTAVLTRIKVSARRSCFSEPEVYWSCLFARRANGAGSDLWLAYWKTMENIPASSLPGAASLSKVIELLLKEGQVVIFAAAVAGYLLPV